MGEPFNIGLIVDEGHVAPHIADLVAWIGTQPGLRFAGVIVQSGIVSQTPRAGFGWKLILAVERRRLRGRGTVESSFTDFGVARRLVRPTSSAVPGTWVLCDEDIAALTADRFDLLIHSGTGTWSGSARRCARLGIIQFNDVANESNRGGPPGFWEVYRRTAKTEFVIRHVSQDAVAPTVLRRGYVPTRTYALLNLDGLLKQASSHLRQLLTMVAETGELPRPATALAAATEYAGPMDRTPNVAKSIAYLCKLSARAASFRFREAVGLRERWGVAYAPSNWRDVKLAEGLKISNPPGRYLADPFLLNVGDETFCFVEDMFEKKERAVISVLQLGPNGYRYLGKAIEEDFHLSFPYLFEYDGDLYMCPESHEAREIRIYKCTRFPLEWKLQSVCMTDVSAVDTMIFASGDRWWMLTNIDNASVGHSFSELHLFWAMDPLSACWERHPRNPVVIDPEFARNAGLIHEGGVTYRVSQARGFGVYGCSASFSAITTIDPLRYEEKLVRTIRPTHERGLTGIHHFSAAGGYAVWDQKRWAWRR